SSIIDSDGIHLTDKYRDWTAASLPRHAPPSLLPPACPFSELAVPGSLVLCRYGMKQLAILSVHCPSKSYHLAVFSISSSTACTWRIWLEWRSWRYTPECGLSF